MYAHFYSFVMQSSSVNAVNVHQASSQLPSHDATSTTVAPKELEDSGVGVTSNDVTMEDNPAYQPIPMSATMESTQSDYV